MSVNARRHRLNMCLGGLVGYDVIASHATSLLHTQKVASSSLASSTFFFFTPPMPLRRPTALFGRLCKKNFKIPNDIQVPFKKLIDGLVVSIITTDNSKIRLQISKINKSNVDSFLEEKIKQLQKESLSRL